MVMEVYNNHNNNSNYINAEVEEGEACYYRDDEDNSIDPDVALSYIDEKVQNVLGHFQKVFEGGLTLENLGAKYGDYGSFLPAYERSFSKWTHPRSPQRNSSAVRSPCISSIEGHVQNLTASQPASTSTSTGARSCRANALHCSNVVSRDVTARREPSVSAALVSNLPFKNETSNRSGNPTDQRSLKFRLRVGPDKNALRNAEIYSGLGLDNSPSTSSGSSSEEIGDSPPSSKEIEDVSPTRILQVMTSFPVPGATFISPLHESLLCMRNERLPKLMDREEEESQSVDKSIAVQGNMEMSKQKKAKMKGRSHGITGQKYENGFDVVDKVMIKVKPVMNEIFDGKDKIPTNFTEVPSLNTSNLGDHGKVAGKVTEALKEAREDVKTEPTHLMKEPALKPVSAQSGDFASQNSRRGSVLKAEENGVSSSRPMKENGKRKGEEYPLHPKGGSCLSKVKGGDYEGEVMDSLGFGQDAAFPEREEKHVSHWKEKPFMMTGDALTNGKVVSLVATGVELSKSGPCVSKIKEEEDCDSRSADSFGRGGPHDAAIFKPKESSVSQKEKTLIVGKKSKDILANGNAATLPSNERLKVTMSTKAKDKGISSQSKIKKHKKSGKHTVMGSPRDTSGRLSVDPAESKIDNFRVASVGKHKKAKSTDVRIMLSKERASEKRAFNSLTSEMPEKDIPTSGLTTTAGLTDTVPLAVQPLVIDEWVCCDLCQKWRLLPYGVKPDEFPDKWICSMLDWLPNMNRCDVTEEETTKTLQARYQIPIHDNQINVNRSDSSIAPAPGVTPTDLYQSTKTLVKPKHVYKDTPNPCTNNASFQVSNSKKKMSDAMKSRSLNDMNQPVPHLHNLKRECFPQLSKQNMPVEKDASKHKKKNVDGANDFKLLKMKGKRKTDPFEFEDETPKRIKADKVNIATNYENSDLKPEEVGLGSGLPSSTKTGEKHKRNGCHSSKEVKHESSSGFSKKYRDQAQFSADSASLDSRTCSKGSNPTKKRKSQDWMDDQNNGRYHHSAKEIVAFKEESGEHVSLEEKKPRVTVTVGKYSSENDGHKRSKKDVEVSTKFLPAPGNHLANGIKKGSDGTDQLLRKHQKIISPQHSLEHMDLLKVDAGRGQFSLAATSSSSKVSGSQQTGTNYEEGRSSPVESVSSSPLRASKLAKFSFKGNDICGNGGAVNKGLLLKSDARKGNGVTMNSSNNPSIAIRKEKVLHGSHSQSFKPAIPDHRDKYSDNKLSCDAEMHPVNVTSDCFEKCENFSGNHFRNHGSDEKRSQKKPLASANSTQNNGNISALPAKEGDRNPGSEFDRYGAKAASLSSKKKVVYSSQGQKHGTVDNASHTKPCEAYGDVRDTSAGKNEKQHITTIESIGHLSDDCRMVEQSKQKKQDLSNGRLGMQSGAVACLQHQSQDSRSGKKGDVMQLEPRSGKTQGTLQCPVQTGLQNGLPNDPVDSSDGNDVMKKLINHGGSKMNQDCRVPALHTAEDHEGRYDVPTSMFRAEVSVQNASDVLKEAKRLRDDADRYKSSGFGFEGNEECFNAALKFLHGASLLEICNGESGRHGETTPLQAYYIAARLCVSCAAEFEGRQEMAAAALAYKCIEVAYMRVVYCKHSSLGRDRHELQATLQMVPQGDSPSSSASDVDNLNNQGVADKHTLLKSTASHVMGSHISVARNRPSVTRLLDFTKDVELAMDASEKSRNSFLVANANIEEAQNKEHMVSVKKVIDFSFQDIEGLISLVQLAREAIGRSGFSGARD